MTYNASGNLANSPNVTITQAGGETNITTPISRRDKIIEVGAVGGVVYLNYSTSASSTTPDEVILPGHVRHFVNPNGNGYENVAIVGDAGATFYYITTRK